MRSRFMSFTEWSEEIKLELKGINVSVHRAVTK